MVKFYQFFFFGQIWRISPQKKEYAKYIYIFFFLHNISHIKRKKKKGKKKMVITHLHR